MYLSYEPFEVNKGVAFIEHTLPYDLFFCSKPRYYSTYAWISFVVKLIFLSLPLI